MGDIIYTVTATYDDSTFNFEKTYHVVFGDVDDDIMYAEHQIDIIYMDNENNIYVLFYIIHLYL